METKICSKCKKVKSLNNFHKQKRSISGYRSTCKECRSNEIKNYYLKHKKQIKNRSKIYRRNNKEKCNNHVKKWMEANKFRYWACVVRRNHKPKNIVNITLKELTDMAIKTKYCNICKIKLDYSLNKGKAQYNSPSLDRIDNENFLNKNNVWIVCKKCNTTKNDRTIKEFIEYCKLVIKNLT